MRWKFLASIAVVLVAISVHAQQLSPQWELLTSEDFIKALDRSQHVCILPFGILEKHGPSGILGSDLVDVRAATFEAVQQDYAVVFPEYYFGQIAESRHQPGTISYPANLQIQLLQATTDEMARNGCRKILIVNGHGGNISLLQYFLQIQLNSPRDYVVYGEDALGPAPGTKLPAAAQPSGPDVDGGHAGEDETSMNMANAPGFAHPERAGEQSGADQHRLNLPPGLSTGIWWYAKFPNQYAGNASKATAARGEALRHLIANRIVEAIRFVKQDTVSPRLQDEFFQKAEKPLSTPQ